MAGIVDSRIRAQRAGREGAGEETAARGGVCTVPVGLRCRDGMGDGSVDKGRAMSVMYSDCTGIGIVCGKGESGGVSGASGRVAKGDEATQCRHTWMR